MTKCRGNYERFVVQTQFLFWTCFFLLAIGNTIIDPCFLHPDLPFPSYSHPICSCNGVFGNALARFVSDHVR